MFKQSLDKMVPLDISIVCEADKVLLSFDGCLTFILLFFKLVKIGLNLVCEVSLHFSALSVDVSTNHVEQSLLALE